MFERFTEAARGVVVEAESLATELGSGAITPVHLLYGCAEVRDETSARPLRDAGLTGTVIRAALPRAPRPAEQIDPDALRAIGVDYDGIRAATEQTFGPGSLDGAPDRRSPAGRPRRPRFTPEAKRSLEQALRVAVELHHRRIQAGHLLLGVLRVDDEDVTRLLRDTGSDVAALSALVMTSLSEAA
ncbi:MAG TPA: Clp protease N-terminal domain-containing protein [Mycobacteriales bacterium]